MKTRKLLNNKTEVASDTRVYHNKSKFDVSILNSVDTSVIYEEYDLRYKALARTDTHNDNRIYFLYRFYPNGCYNVFTVDRNEAFSKETIDPLYNGYRGVYFKENGRIDFNFFAEFDQHQHIGKQAGTFTFSGDTLFVKKDYLPYQEIYIKLNISKEFLKFKADW